MRGSVGEEQVRGRWRVRGRRGGSGVAPPHEVCGRVGSWGQRSRRQLLLHCALLYVVTELGGRHAVGALAARLQLGAAEFGLRECGSGKGKRLCAERRRGGKGGRRGRRRSGCGLHRPEALGLGVECAGHLQSKWKLIMTQ